MADHDVSFMRDLEVRYREASGLTDRSQYRIFYGPVRPAEVLVLGINPGGDPAEVMPDGVGSRSGGKVHSASASYFENDESDVLDCDWPENRGLLKVLLPLADNDLGRLRARMFKTNMAFRRSSKVNHIDIEAAKVEAAPFLGEILGRVRPQLVLLAGLKLEDFTGRFCNKVQLIGDAIRDPGVKQTVFRAARAELRGTGTGVFVVQLAHASQFGWTYEKYGVVERIRSLLGLESPRRTPDVVRNVPMAVLAPEVITRDSPELPNEAMRDHDKDGMNVAGYEAMFRKLGFTSFESHKKLRHPELGNTLYFNRDKTGFVSFVVYAKDGAWFKPDMWDYIGPRKVKDDAPGLRTVVPKAGREELAFRDLLRT